MSYPTSHPTLPFRESNTTTDGLADVLVVGSLAYDTIATPAGSVERTLGGSANYFSLAASFFAPVKVVGVVGLDYNATDRELLEKRGIDLSGIQQVPGKTFHWAGSYTGDMNEARTLATELNVFANFEPRLPANYRTAKYVFLANIDPELQLRVLDQVERPQLVAADTMNFWIQSKRPILDKVLERIDVLLINEGEAELLTEQPNAIAAADALIHRGPKVVVVKRGEYGFVMRTKDGFFILPSFPIARVVDPTGAGDTFAGGFFGTLAALNAGPSVSAMKTACINGCLFASFTVEAFGVERLRGLSRGDVVHRWEQYLSVISR